MATTVGDASVELRLEPREVEPALDPAGDRRVAGDEAEVADARRVRGLAAEVLAQPVAVVVVAGQHVHGHGQRRQQLRRALVLGRERAVGDVAGHQHRVRERPHREHLLDRGGQRRGGPLVLWPDVDVRVAELGEERAHWPLTYPPAASAC